MEVPPNAKAQHLRNGLVKFPPNVHGIYVESQDGGLTHLVVRQNDTRFLFLLEAADCEHLASLLLRAAHES